MHAFQFDAIGTFWNIDLYRDFSDEHIIVLKNEIEQLCESYDKTYSRFRADSFITELSQKAITKPLPSDAKPLLNLYKKLYDITGGLFTPFVGDILHDLGYDANYTFKQKKIRKPLIWDQTLQLTEKTISMKKPCLLDFGAAGKGYLIDTLGKLLEKHNCHAYCIDGSGDFLYKNTENKPIRIGLENPLEKKQVVGVSTLPHGSLCGSSGNRRTWGNYHHIINPKNLQSPTTILATWVVAENALLADALATCLFLVPSVLLQPHFSFEYALIYDNMKLEKSNTFPGEFFFE